MRKTDNYANCKASAAVHKFSTHNFPVSGVDKRPNTPHPTPPIPSPLPHILSHPRRPLPWLRDTTLLPPPTAASTPPLTTHARQLSHIASGPHLRPDWKVTRQGHTKLATHAFHPPHVESTAGIQTKIDIRVASRSM
ncbi:hypothetical protein E2C01_042992 [Portunus trituberculatus]|uniref:Uncharacterized protein n=1 Tax=Portunus trituberculatus TaxID=210409 RepID=A0A5B7FUH3_PORTR|nr:hypothetical protein [Portunus trituberculatus]